MSCGAAFPSEIPIGLSFGTGIEIGKIMVRTEVKQIARDIQTMRIRDAGRTARGKWPFSLCLPDRAQRF